MGGEIYTLAQSRTNNTPKPTRIVTGKGSDLSNGSVAESRGKRKFLTIQMTLALIDVAKEKKNSKIEKMLWNSFHCQRKITSANGIIYGNYCKNRCCTVCLAIRKADLINRYFPILSTWEQSYFVTLTVKSCSAKQLPKRMDKMIKGFQLICDRQRKRHSRGKDIQLIGVRSLECNFNPVRRTYNPHFHVIVKNKEIAETLKREWLIQWTTQFAQPWCQDIRPIFDIKTGLIEIIKYGTKIFTEPDLTKKAKGQKGPRKIYVRALYNILNSMNKHRLFDRFGFKVKATLNKPVGASVITNFTEWIYLPKQRDWIDKKTGELLTNYIPPPNILNLLQNNLDLTSE